jgi:isochorismate synthase
MTIELFLKKISSHYQSKLPFVCFSKQRRLKAYLQTDDKIYRIEDFKSPGFVFCPFSNKTSIELIFPCANSDELSAEIIAKEISSKFRTFQEPEEAKQKHEALVSKAIEKIKNSDVQKIVCSRKLSVNYKVNPIEIFQKLAQKYPEAFSYCWYHPKVGLWIGASPEQFIHLDRNHLHSVALAGTIDANKHAKPNWSSKEIEEQQMVTDFIGEALQSNALDIKISEVQNVKAGQLWHLKTKISAKINIENISEIISNLHPTSAVCGLPRTEAERFIEIHEDYDRQYYSGFLGEMHVKQEIKRQTSSRNQEQMAIKSIKKISDLYVNLRCMEVFEDHVEIYVGGGITKDSDPKAEYLETVAKSQTLLNVL